MLKPAGSLRARAEAIDRSLGRHAERVSRWLWPWPERRLLLLVGAAALLDFTSTFVLLELSGRGGVYESGLIAGWALHHGGFAFLLIVDVLAAAALSLAAFSARFVYTRRDCPDYGRAAFVFLLLPYLAFAGLAVVNNLVLLIR